MNVLNQAFAAVLAAAANSFWPALAAVAGVWAALRLLPSINAATRHLIWWAVLAAIVTMPAAPLLLQTHRSARTAAPAVAAQTGDVPAPATAALPPIAAPAPAAVPAPSAGISLRAGNWPARIFFLWLAVLLMQLGRIAYSYRYLIAVKRRALRASPEMRRDFDVWKLACGVHRPVQLLVSREIVSPMAVGFRAPAVIVPEALLAEFNESELDHVLLHELAHLARRDDWTNLACRMAWAAVALHPAAAWTLRRIEREREMACDDWVVAATGAARPYAASLARLFELCLTRRRALLATGMAERGSELGDRIEVLLRRGREFTARANVARVALSVAALVLFVAIVSHAPRWIALAQDEPAAQSALPAAPAVPADAAPAQPAAAPAAPAAPAVPTAAATPAPAEPAAPSTPQAAPAAPAAPASANPTSFLAALVAAGYGNLSVDEIIALKNAGVSADFLNGMRQSGLGKSSPQDLVAMRNHGVSPEYLRQIRSAGLSGLTVPDVIDLRNNGVDPAWVREIESAGLGAYNKQDIIEFRRNGVSAELLSALKEAGFQGVDARAIVELQQQGVGRRNLQEARQYGPNLTLRQIIRLKQAGVI